MDVFQEYKPIRNKTALLARDDALAVIWAYCQYLQMKDFRFPREIEVKPEFLELDVPQQWVSEWGLEQLAKEVILNAGAISQKGQTLRSWKTFASAMNWFRDLENKIYGHFGSQESVLVELIRIAHRQFIWQGNRPNSAAIIRHFRIFNRPTIDQICLERIGLTVWQIYMCGVACMGHFLDHPAIHEPFKSDIKALSPEMFERFFSFAGAPLSTLKLKLKSEQEYNENFAYAYNSLRAYPLVRMTYKGADAIVCPLMTLLFWRFTGGLYYQLISDARFPNEFGDGFQLYVGDVIDRACTNSKMQRIPETEYWIGKQKKRSVDWIVADENSAIFLECKAKRLSWGAKVSLSDLAPLQDDIDAMASALIQVYKTLVDYLKSGYPNFAQKDGRSIYPTIVTPENWRMFGPVMLDKLAEAVSAKLSNAGLSPQLAAQFPYSVWAIEDLEAGLQIMDSIGIADFMDGKLRSAEMVQWDWHGYTRERSRGRIALKSLFDKEYRQMFSRLFDIQGSKQAVS